MGFAKGRSLEGVLRLIASGRWRSAPADRERRSQAGRLRHHRVDAGFCQGPEGFAARAERGRAATGRECGHDEAQKCTRRSGSFSWLFVPLCGDPSSVWISVHPRFHSGPAARFPAFVSSRYSGKRDAGVPHAGGGVGLRPPSPRSSRCALRYAAGEEHGGERARERVGERARDRSSDYPASAFSLRPSALPRWLAVRRTGFGAVRGAGGSGRAFRFAVMEAC